MTFKQFQEKYIQAYKEKKVIDAPTTMFDDFQSIYDTFIKQTELAMEQLKKEDITFKDRLDAVALIDFCTMRCNTLITQYRDICNAVNDYNDSINNKKS